MKTFSSLLMACIVCCSFSVLAQSSIVRGKVYDQSSGDPVLFATVRIPSLDVGTTSDEEGFFSIPDVPYGEYELVASFVGYDSSSVSINVKSSDVIYQNIYISESSVALSEVSISANRTEARTEVQMSQVRLTPKRLKSLPSVGAQADLAQYLPVLPGVVFSGDQGGQLYIRGGSPVQNRVIMDGMTIYNPFHSIGFFSVFETEAIRTVDVYTGGFSAEYGGRTSAIIDIKTREGNRKKLSGIAAVDPFQAKLLLEGPLVPLRENEEKGTISFILTGKTSLIQETSKSLYAYASDTAFYNLGLDRIPEGDTIPRATPEEVGLPFSFTDLYGKLSFVSANGSKFNLFGFSHSDMVDYSSLDLNWDSYGFGANFSVLPPGTNLIADGTIAVSNYDVSFQRVGDRRPRTSSINSFSILLNFSTFPRDAEIKYGLEFSGISTELSFENFRGVLVSHDVNTTEIAPFFKYRQKFGKLIIDPSFRAQFYTSLGNISLEPRLGLKYNVNNRLRLKMAAGIYSQNLISTTNDLDIVNLFNGYITDPQDRFTKPGTDETTDNKLQKATHLIGGIEYDISDNITFNVEPYLKDFNQIITINRNRASQADPLYSAEEGEAYGIDLSVKYETRKWYGWLAYSLAKVTRFDGVEEYAPIFDRRHNVNLLVTYKFGNDLQWEASGRLNYGTGFPFTKIQGFGSTFPVTSGVGFDPRVDNPDLQVIPSDTRNGGRLPAYSRLDLALKYHLEFSQSASLDVVASATNVNDRENIFFFVPEENERVDQLPILPSLGVVFSW